MAETLRIVEIRYITPDDIKPGYTLTAQYITKGHQYLYAPYQAITEQIARDLDANIPGQTFLAGFTDKKITIPDAAQIEYFEKEIASFLEEQCRREYYRSLTTVSGDRHPLADYHVSFEEYISGGRQCDTPSLAALSAVPGFSHGKVSLARMNFTPQDIERMMRADNRIAEPIIFGNYKREAVSELIEKLIKRQFRGTLKPESIGCAVSLVIDKSYSMREECRLSAAKFAGNVFYRQLLRFYPRDSIKVYAFAGWTERIEAKKIGAIRLGPSTFLGNALGLVYRNINRKLLVPKNIYVFTDGIPHDFEETLEVCEKIREAHIDFNLVLFKPSPEELEGYIAEFSCLNQFGTDINEIYERMVTEIARAAGGNITVIKQNRFLAPTQISIHEHYKICISEHIMSEMAKNANLN